MMLLLACCCCVAASTSCHVQLLLLWTVAVTVGLAMMDIATNCQKAGTNALQAKAPVGGSMCQMMLRVYAARGQGQLAVALLKDMRAVGLYLTPSAYSLMVQAFCKAGALQVSTIIYLCYEAPLGLLSVL